MQIESFRIVGKPWSRITVTMNDGTVTEFRERVFGRIGRIRRFANGRIDIVVGRFMNSPAFTIRRRS